MVDVDAAGVQRVVDEITAAGGTALGLSADLTKDEDSRRIVWETVNRFKGLAAEHEPRGPHVDVVNDFRDPLPSAPFLAVMLRHPGGLVRPFLKSSGNDAYGQREATDLELDLPAG